MGLTPAWTQMRYHPMQSALWRTRELFPTAQAGRGSGKSEVAKRYITRMLPVKKPWPNPKYFYGLPTYQQAENVAWNDFQALIPKDWIAKINQSKLTIDTVFGSRLFVVGFDKPARFEGQQVDGGVLDEASDQRPGLFSRTLVPMLTHRNGFCWRIGVTKRYGIGAQEFNEAHDAGIPGVSSFTWSSEDILTPEQLEAAKNLLDEKDFDEQFRAMRVAPGGVIFFAFDETENVGEREYDPDVPLIVASDFNVNPMCWVLIQVHDGIVYVIDELFIRDCNTQMALDALWIRYGSRQRAGFEFYGDPAAHQRHTNATKSDYIIIRSDERFTPKRIFYPESHPLRRDRFASCNAMFRNAAGVRRCRVSPKCRYFIADLKARVTKPGTSEPDDGDARTGTGHMTDAFGYYIHYRHPLRSALQTTAKREVSISGRR